MSEKAVSILDREKRKKTLEKLRDNLPKGYISKKNINGRTYEYYQWTEDGKKKSRDSNKIERRKSGCFRCSAGTAD